MHVVIDTDTAGDDVVALLLALKTPWVTVEGVTINCGNVAFDFQVENALKTIDVAGRAGAVPVYPGARAPLLRDWVSADYVHGKDGMGEAFFPPVSQRPERENAVPFLLRTARQYSGDLVVVAQAPLTNLALAVRQDPAFASHVKELWVMGGSLSGLGNVAPLSEYNFYVDPEAAAIVFGAGFNLYMVGWDVALEAAVLTEEELQRIEAMNTPLSQFFLATQAKVLEFNRTQSIAGTTHPDALTMALALDRRLLRESRDYFVAIETRGEFTRGTSVVDRLGVWRQKPNSHVVTQVDRDRFHALLLRLLEEGATRLPEPR
ncbi:MAG: nucleoside hydrolase [Firmicutes bacterium]|nr:nucleoside hydrolase [Bacillota bacterium]